MMYATPLRIGVMYENPGFEFGEAVTVGWFYRYSCPF